MLEGPFMLMPFKFMVFENDGVVGGGEDIISDDLEGICYGKSEVPLAERGSLDDIVSSCFVASDPSTVVDGLCDDQGSSKYVFPSWPDGDGDERLLRTQAKRNEHDR